MWNRILMVLLYACGENYKDKACVETGQELVSHYKVSLHVDGFESMKLKG